MTTPKTPTVELLPCPFCGGKEMHIGTYVICKSCGAEGPAGILESKAIEAWNIRNCAAMDDILVKDRIKTREINILTAEVNKLRPALIEARAFVDRHSEPWYVSGQELLAKIDAAIDAAREGKKT